MGMLGQFGKGLVNGVANGLWQPIAQTLDLAQVGVGILTLPFRDTPYQPHWFSAVGQAAESGNLTTAQQIELGLGSVPVLGVGVGVYGLTTSALNGDWNGFENQLGNVAGGLLLLKGGEYAGSTISAVNSLSSLDTSFLEAPQGNAVVPDSGASSLVNGARLNMQLTAEQAAGVRMPTQITGYSDHALEQIASRDSGIGVDQNALLDAWDNPSQINYVPSKYGPTFRLTGNNAAIVVNADGKVVTGWATSAAGAGQ